MNNEYSIESANDPHQVTQLLEDRIYKSLM